MVVTDILINDDKILEFAHAFAKKNQLKLTKKGWLAFAEKDHPHYTIMYRDSQSKTLKHFSFTYTDSITKQCNSKCNSIG